jgi:phasin
VTQISVSRNDVAWEGNSAVSENVQKENPNGTTDLNGTNGFALPGAFGALAEQGIARAQAGCEKAKVVSEQMGEALRETYSANAESATSYGLKLIEISNANTAAVMDYFFHLLGSKSVSEIITLSAEQARKTFDATSAQNRELWGLAQKLTAEASEPVRKRVASVFQKAG